MCTLLTIDRSNYHLYRKAILKRIRADAAYNADGFSLVGMDTDMPESNIQVQAMNIEIIVSSLHYFFLHASFNSRIFLHSRAATTGNIGLQYCHGFTDFDGNIIMHNGILSNPEGWAVDSFRLIHNVGGTSRQLLEDLLAEGETFANIFVINDYEYQVVRLSKGSLYTDGIGNYSTNAVGSINRPVPTDTASTHEFLCIEEANDENWGSPYLTARAYK
jgi:predicted glutamine amidotransferase